MRIIIAGSRSFDDYALLCKTMDRLVAKLSKVIVISGTAKGADSLGEKWAYSRWHTVERYHPDYSKHGKSAPLIRNTEMVNNAEAAVLFWDLESTGTEDLIKKARKKGLRVKIIAF